MKNFQIHGEGTPPDSFTSKRQAALFWFNFGFKVIPILPGGKKPAVKWNPWLKDLSPEKIIDYLTRNPNHELGFILDDDIIVFDADSPQSIVALAQIEETFDLTPNLVVKTKKGEHHYFRRAKGTFAKSDSHSTEKFPERIDVKTGRSLVILPNSTGKEIEICEANSANDLTEIDQDAIDAVFRHNGRSAPRPQEIVPSPRIPSETQSQILIRLKARLEHLDPDCGYEDWLHILMAIFHETGGSEEGFELADSWSSKGKKYKGTREIRDKWNSFKSGTANPITMGTLNKMLEDKGINWKAVCSESEDPFKACEYEIINPSELSTDDVKLHSNPLDKFSLRGMSEEMARLAFDAVFVLWLIALQGQLTVIYAAPNTGKTLIILFLLIETIKDGRVDPSNVYYINVDDTHMGLTEKLRLADEYGFHMLADGYKDFEAGVFLSNVQDMIEKDQARGVIVILDTLKKFTDLMDKRKSSNFTKIMRQFVLKGGTLIALSHTNKHPDAKGKPVYGGVSDIVNDFDCAYTIATVSEEAGKRVVEFENKKRRGSVVHSTAYSYSTEHGIAYTEILLSVAPVDQLQLEPLKQAEQQRSDAEIVDTVKACISEGINTKMKLADAVAKNAGVSKRIALKIIEKYTGEDPSLHRWKFNVADRGAKVFVLLESISPEP